jgi:small-conductance mechanosensitive channel
LVYLHQFNDSSVDFRLLFWGDVERTLELKSDVGFAIDALFHEMGVEIPFP